MSYRRLGIVLVAALALRVGALVLTQDTPPAGDESGYLRRAVAIAAGTPEETLGTRPPAYSWWGAAWIGGADDPAAAMRRAGLFTGLAIVALTAILGARNGGSAAGVVAAATVALYPGQILYDVSLWSESLYATLLLGAVLLAVAAAASVTRAALLRAAGAGVLFGLGALTREVGLLALLAAAIWLATHGGRWRRLAAASLIGAAALVVLPWSIARSWRAGTPVLVSQTTGQNLFLGNWADPDGARGPLAGPVRRARYESLGETRAAREAEAGRLARSAITERMPAWPFEKIASEIPDLLSPQSVPAARLAALPDSGNWQGRWAYRLGGPLGAPLARQVSAAVVVGAWVILGALGVLGLALPGGRLTPLFIGLVAAHVVPVIVAFGITRFRMPLVPLLAITAATLAVDPRAAWAGASRRRRVIALLSLALFLIALALRWSSLESPGFG